MTHAELCVCFLTLCVFHSLWKTTNIIVDRMIEISSCIVCLYIKLSCDDVSSYIFAFCFVSFVFRLRAKQRERRTSYKNAQKIILLTLLLT